MSAFEEQVGFTYLFPLAEKTRLDLNKAWISQATSPNHLSVHFN